MSPRPYADATRGGASREPACAAIGFTVKSGWATAVLLVDESPWPRVVESRRVELSDPAIPDSRQPYHAGFGTARDAGPELLRLVASVKRFGRQSVLGVIREYRAAGHPVQGVGLVVGSLIDPASIANPHIRIHALEGQLFRAVVLDAAARSRLSSMMWREKELLSLATTQLRRSDTSIRRTLVSIGRAVEGAWRTEQKSAALAAWMVISSRAAA